MKLNLPLSIDEATLEIVDSLDNRIADVDTIQMGKIIIEIINKADLNEK